MDEFPEELNRGNCMEQLKKNQAGIIKDVRKDFYEQILQSINNSDKAVTLEYPSNLWPENRLVITKELLARFGVLKVSTPNNNYVTTKTASDEDDLPINIKSIRIEFYA